MGYNLVLALVSPVDDEQPELPLLTRARLLAYPFVRRRSCEERLEADGYCGCGCLWDDAIVGRRFCGCLWRDRYGMLPADHPVNDPEDEPRLVADVNLRATRLVPEALIAPDGYVHHLGGTPDAHTFTPADYAIIEDRLMEHPGFIAVPFSCHS